MKFIVTLLLFLCAFCANAQKFKGKPKPLPRDTIKFVEPQIDSALLQENIELNNDVQGIEIAPAEIGEVYADEPEIIYEKPVNRFIYKKDIKTEEHPDVQASYKAGTDSMLRELYEKVSVPYTYMGNDYYVLLQITVGKDSALYNPVALYSPGSSYTINAQHAVEQLQGKFNPATKKGVPVNSTIIIPVRFVYLRNNSRYH